VEFAATGSVPLQVRGIYEADGYLDGDYIVSRATQEANVPGSLVASVLVVLEDGADVADVKAAISAALRDHPDAKVLDRRQYEQEMGGIVDNLLTLVYVMLLLAVVIALLGIVNTLALSVYERTRELGLLRAVGMTTAQVRAMVRWESVVISLIGALTGVAVGVGVGLALARSLEDDGITEVAVPGLRIAVFVALAAVAGVVAATGPARSASRVDVLRAVVTD
jgi:putative ABC transport system permease protein